MSDAVRISTGAELLAALDARTPTQADRDRWMLERPAVRVVSDARVSIEGREYHVTEARRSEGEFERIAIDALPMWDGAAEGGWRWNQAKGLIGVTTPEERASCADALVGMVKADIESMARVA